MGDDSDENSDDNLKIVIDSPNSKRKTFPEPSKSEKLIIESFEDELQRRLEEKAAKTNLNATNVKNIIKHVVTNEHVLALVKKAENHEFDESIPYEPKLTRAKAKELLSSVPDTWNTLKPASGVQVLFSEDLQEDSSGDEYVPCEEESEDDRDGSIISDPPSVQPPTPSTPLANTDSCTQMNLTDDGIFKIPPSKSKEDIEEEANIALRTRSKFSLSSTPLEVIEEAFIPPDITTDMYDMDYDNDDWIDFLKKFTRPLDEVAKPTEDEEHDPEYNILADAEIDKIDKEELRVDKAVKISRKELNNLIAELFDSEFVTTSNSMEMGKKNKSTNENNEVEVLNYCENGGITDTSQEKEENMVAVINESVVFEEGENILIKRSQIPLLQQQMRQHIQLLTQNFILTYQHPELHNYSIQAKEYMMNLKFLCEGKEKSVLYEVNLFPAIQLIEHWEHFLATDSIALKNLKRHIEKTMAECIKRKQSGNSYFPSFPQLILETISNSEVFLYPFLLPKIPFKPNTFFPRCIVPTFTDSEDQLIALGLEQFESLLKRNRKNITKTGEVILKQTCSFIQEYMMPHRDTLKIYHHINCFKKPRCGNNPIKYYFQYKKAPPVVHLVSPLDELQILPPCKRLPDHLPYQWKIFNYPNLNVTSSKTPSVPSFKVSTEQVQHSGVNILNPQITTLVLDSEKLILPKAVTSTPFFSNRRKIFAPFKRRKLYTKTKGFQQQDPITKFVKCLSRPSVINRLFGHDSDSAKYKLAEEINTSTNLQPIQIMLPSMPSLGTPIKTHAKNEVSNGNPNKYMNEEETNTKNESRKYVLPEISTISSSSFQRAGTSTEVEFCKPLDNSQTIASISKRESSGGFLSSSQEMSHNNTCNEKVKDSSFTSLDKDNVDSTPNLTVKPSVRKEPSGAEKKRAKLRKEFLANLSVTAPEDPDIEKQKSEMFALAYYDKMRENLELEDYHKIMQILNDHEEGDAADLYKKIEKVLVPKYQELADEFLLFLREKEAAAVGQLIPWISMNNRSKFLRKLEIYFKDQPAQLRKIYKCLTELSLSLDVSMEKIKSTLLPMFKGNSVLTDLFLQIFLSERPPLSLLEGPYETIDVAKELPKQDNEEIIETITVPDTEDKYGGSSCICNCHQIEDPEFKSRYRHCIRCGTRFVNGKVFIQSGKGLRPATVSFTTNPTEDHSTRLMGKTAPSIAYYRKKGSESSSSKQISLSPPKENPDEETEDETDGKKKSKRSSKKKLTTKTSKSSKEPAKNVLSKKKKTCKTNRNKFSISPIHKECKPNRKGSFSVKKSKVDKKADEHVHEKIIAIKAGATVGQQKRLAEDSMEWEHNQILPSDLKPNSPDQQTAESESEFCEESSQDNCESDSNSSISSINNQTQSDSNTGEECLWKREEDKIILETFQKENDKEHAFEIIANQLKNRTVIQISNRFQTLMTLLLETLGNS